MRIDMLYVTCDPTAHTKPNRVIEALLPTRVSRRTEERSRSTATNRS